MAVPDQPGRQLGAEPGPRRACSRCEIKRNLPLRHGVRSVGGAMNDEIALLFAGQQRPRRTLVDATGTGGTCSAAGTRGAAPSAAPVRCRGAPAPGAAPGSPPPCRGRLAGAPRSCSCVTPALALMALFIIWPVISAVRHVQAPFRWKGFGPMDDFIGLDKLRAGCSRTTCSGTPCCTTSSSCGSRPDPGAARAGHRVAAQPAESGPWLAPRSSSSPTWWRRRLAWWSGAPLLQHGGRPDPCGR